ncbi:MAG: helix-turn-helix domain-containing protein [Patescibacteria group bacterium]
MNKATIRLTISQAANLFGVSQKTIRRAIQDQEILYIVVRGVYKINFESMLKWSQSRVKIKNKLEKQGIGQYVEKWKIKNRLFSPNPKTVEKDEAEVNKDKCSDQI